MLVHPKKRGETNVKSFIEFLKAAAGGQPTTKPMKRPPSGKRKVEKATPAPRRRKPKR